MGDAASDDAPPPQFDVARVVVWCAALAVVVGGVVAAFLLPRREEVPPADELPVRVARGSTDVAADASTPPPAPTTGLFDRPVGELPDVAAVERSGLEMRTSDLKGRYTVFDFVFSSCSGTCPPLQDAMRKLQTATAGREDVRMVSVTVDPDVDTPARMLEWADALGADRSRWLFLRAEKSDVRRLMQEGLKVPAGDDLLTHSGLFVLTDPDGRVRGRYAPLDHPGWLEMLLADLDTLRRGRVAR